MPNWGRLAVLINDVRRKIVAKAKAEGKKPHDAFNEAFVEVMSRSEFSIITDWVEARHEIGKEMASWKKRGMSKETTYPSPPAATEVDTSPETPALLSIGGMKRVGKQMVTFVATWTGEHSLVVTLEGATVVTLKKDAGIFSVVSTGSLVPGGEPLPHAGKIAKTIAEDLASERISPQKRLFR